MHTLVRQTSFGGISASSLKLLAISGMTLDHIGVVFGHWLPLWAKVALYTLGGLTYPIMAYLLVEGYRHTSNLKRYGMRLLLYAIAAQVPYMWATRGISLNVLFTLSLGLITLYLYDNFKNRTVFWFVFTGLTLATGVMDWPLMGVPMVLLYYTQRAKWRRLILPVLLPMGMMALQAAVQWIHPEMSAMDSLPSLAFAFIGCSLTIPLLANYNGKRGRPLKYLFYVYYPGHLLALSLIRGFLFGIWPFQG